MRALTVGNMYPPHHLGGYELVWRSAAEHLRARGHEVSVLTADYRRPGVDAPDPDWVHRDLLWWWRDHAWPRFGPRERLRRERHNAAVLEQRLREDRPDVVLWLAMGGMSLSLIERVRRLGIPAVGVVHDDWLVYGPRVDAWLRMWAGPRGGIGERLTGVPVRVDFSGAAHWLFVSDFVRRKALERGGLQLARTGIAHSGIDEAHLQPLGPARPWSWRLLSVGRIDPRKGIDTAIEALTELPEEAVLSIAGEGDAGTLAELRAHAARLGLGERVRFLGFQDTAQLAALYAEADTVVFPVTWDEPWGLVPIEAMAHGVPVVATGRGGSAEYLRDGNNALLHEAGDPSSLAAALHRLAADDALRQRLREGGAQTAPRHTARRFNEQLESALREATDV
ncbi:MAG: glycosyltransferase family 1 protein [Solirubrobacterales bacterium]|nr:glycosyltransferase family 1 protein [Solirubrobacterales bacterium]